LQKAVRKALGELVDAETLTEKEEIIKDEVLTYSDGFVESRKVINGPDKDPDLGLYTVTIEAVVVRSKVLQRLNNSKKSVAIVSGENLWAEAMTKQERTANGIKMLEKLLNEEMLPSHLIKAEMISQDRDGRILRGSEAKPQIEPNKEGTVELTFNMEISFDQQAFYDQVLPRLTKVLDQICIRKIDDNFQRPLKLTTKQKLHITGQKLLTTGDDYLTPALSVYREQLQFGGSATKINRGNEQWNMNHKEEFLVACELGASPDRQKCRFAIYLLNRDKYMASFVSAKSRRCGIPTVTISDKSGNVIWKESPNKFHVLFQENGKIKEHYLNWPDTGYSDSKDPYKNYYEGLLVYRDGRYEGPSAVTISPEFEIARKVMVTTRYVTSRKIVLSKENLKRIHKIVASVTN
jgi:hypothetical protein